ncbi:hypothetical protein [Fluviicola sp.]|uniref:hypothetical protein n=1 Tax=Fluviicola sp. TaxID=1917219 RepID=UPI003D272B5B
MKQLLLFVFALLFYTSVFTQNYINEVVIEHELIETNAYSWIGQMKQTKASIRMLDSLNIGMIITKSKYPESGHLAHMGIDTLYVHKGRITELIQFQNCYKAIVDSKGRVTEKFLSRSPNSPIEEIWIFQYDSLDFPIYSLKVRPGDIRLLDNRYRYNSASNEERFALPHYNTQGILDTITYSKGNSVLDSYAVIKQDSYKNGDSIVITRTFYDAANESQRVDYFLRTVHTDTVQIRFYENRIDQFQEFTRNYLNGLEVESYFESRGVYTDATIYNSLGLPIETFGTGVTNEGRGNLVTHYEYYTIDPGKKNRVRLVKME